jgi:hypothetical protein
LQTPTGIAGNVSIFSALPTNATVATTANSWLGVYFATTVATTISINSVKYEIISQ